MEKLSVEKLQETIKNNGKWLMDNGGSRANLSRADLSRADLRGANLSRADLIGADLRGANLDFSCLPLWCGSLNMTVDKKIAVQILYHFCRLKCDDEDVIKAQKQMFELANQFHRVDECGRLGE